MYKVYIDGELAWYPGDELLVLNNCELHLALNDSGTFEFDITSDSAFYDRISSRMTMVQVLKDDKELFYGEVRDISRDLYNVKHVYCVGELAFLFDSIQPQAVYHDLSPRQMLEAWLNEHNSQVEAKKQYQTGIVTVHDSNDSLYRMTNRENTLDAIRDKLCDKLGGFLKVRKVNGVRYLDWLTLEDYGKICEQLIQFGRNLLDYSEDTTADDLYTKVIPLGARLDESPVEGLEAYVDITSVNGGKDYLYIPEAVERYGWVPVVVHWDDVTLPANLKTKGEEWLRDNQYETMTLELNAVDLSVLSSKFDTFELGDRVHALAAPYGMDRYFPVQKLDIYLQEPDRNILVLGNVLRKSYTEQSRNAEKNINQNLDELKITSSFLKSAIDNATQMMTGSKGGYKVTEYDEDGRWLRDLYMDALSKEAAQHIMQINMNGIGFSRDGFSGPYKNAWTIDGVLLGECLKAGSVQAEALSVEYRQSVQKEIEDAETGAKEYAESYTTTAIKAAEDKISLSVEELRKYANGIEENLSGRIDVISDSVTAEVKRAKGAESDLSAALKLASDQISLKVTKGDVQSLITQSADTIRLKAAKIAWESTYSSMSSSGILKCSSAELKGTMKCGTDSGYWVQLSSGGKLTGGYGSSQYGYIDYSATVNNTSTGATHRGLQIQGGCLRISVNELATRSTSNVGTTAYVGGTGNMSYVSSIEDNGDGSITWHTTTIRFENGLMVTDL